MNIHNINLTFGPKLVFIWAFAVGLGWTIGSGVGEAFVRICSLFAKALVQ